MIRLSGAVLRSFLMCAALFVPARALDSASPSYRNSRSSLDAGGVRKTSSPSFRADASVGAVSVESGASANFRNRDGFMGVAYQPARITDLWASSTSVSTQIYLQWTAPGNDGDDDTAAGAFVIKYSSISSVAPAGSDARFNAAFAIALPPAPGTRGTRHSLNVTGLASGVTYYFAIEAAERDGARGVLSAGATAQTLAPSGCEVVRNVHQVDGPYTSIQDAVDALPSSLSGQSCVVIRDGATYPEHVTVQNFTMNGSSITIMADPASGLRPVVSPPALSTAAFRIVNSSVNIFGIDVVASQNMPYGIWASSGYVQISSVNVSTTGSLGIYDAGIRISSWTTVSYSSVTVWNAHGLWLDATAQRDTVSYSTFQAKATAGSGHSGLHIQGSSNAFTVVLASNTAGWGMRLDIGANYNTISLSTAASGAAGGFFAFLIEGASSNTITQSYIANPFGHGLYVKSGSNYNTISGSTLNVSGVGMSAMWVYASSWNTITQSFITSPAGHGAYLVSSGYNTISVSTLTANAGYRALFIDAASSNTIVDSYMQNLGGWAASLQAGSGGNTISRSTMISNIVTGYGLILDSSDGNLVADSFISNPAGYGAILQSGSDGNTISRSTMTSAVASYSALYIVGSDSNIVDGSYVYSSLGYSLRLNTGADYNTISQTTVTNSNATFAALNFGDSDSNTVTGSFIFSPVGYGAFITSGADYNTISQSTVSVTASGMIALYIAGSASNTVTGSYIANTLGYGMYVNAGANYNAVSQSTLTGTGAGYYALWINASDSNTVIGSRLANPSGTGVYLFGGADYNVISLSTMTGAGTDRYGLYVVGSASNTILGGYVQGSTAAYVSGSTSTAFGGTTFAATNAAGSALALDGGSVNLAIATSTLLAPSSGRGLALNPGSVGVVSLGSVTFSGAGRGVEISTQGAGFTLAVDSVTFRGLASGATAIHFLGGTFVATITLASFESAPTGVNVSAAALDPASRLTMNAHSGARTGPAYENDPNGLVDWQELNPYPGCVVTKNVGAGQDYATIQAGVNALPATLSGHSCVVIRDGATYAEQVTVQNFANGGSSITIRADPAGARPTIDPPAATAAFVIANASVNITGIDIKPTIQSITYGVWASSAYVNISSVNVDAAGKITTAGVRVNSWSTVSYASVTVTDAHGFWLDGSTATSVAFSTAVNNSAASYAVHVEGGGNNAFTVLFASNSHASGYGFKIQGSTTNTATRSYLWGGIVGAWLNAGSAYNGISLSTMIGGAAYGFLAGGADSNTVTQSYMSGGTRGADLIGGSDFNSISLSTMIGVTKYGLYIGSSDSNTVAQSYMWGSEHGAWLTAGADSNQVNLSTMIGSTQYGLFADASDSNTVTQSYMQGADRGANLASGADRNVIGLSTMIGGTGAGLSLDASTSNTVTQSYMSGDSGVVLGADADRNVISLSTVIGANYGLNLGGADSNLVTQSYMWGAVYGAYLGSGFFNTISLSTMICNTSSSANDGLYLTSAASNTVTQSYMRGGGAGAIMLFGSDYNTISLSTMIAATDNGFYADDSDSNVVTGSYMFGPVIGANLNAGADYNTISLSTMIGGSTRGLYIKSDHNTVTRSYMRSTSNGARLDTGADFNTISLSTMISDNAANPALHVFKGSSNTILDSYVQGSTAALISGSTGTVVGGTVFIATSTIGSALALAGGNVNLTIATSTLFAQPAGRGLALNPGSVGVVSLGSVTFSGAGRGIEISTQGAGFSLLVDSITFRGLASGATAIHFLGGTFIATITLANFEDATSAVNVSGAALDPASRVTMRAPRGTRQGPGFENDPNALVEWPDLVSPVAPAVFTVGLSSIGVQYGLVSADGYLVEASTMADFSGILHASSTLAQADRLAPQALDPNTTYFLRTGALWGGSTVYAQLVLSTATLTKLVSGTTVYRIDVTSMVVNWLPLALAPPDASSESASGYVLEVSTRSDFVPLWTSSATLNAALSTLTVSGLLGGDTYFFRVGSLNWNGAANYSAAVSTLMPIQLGVELTTHTLSLPGLTDMNTTILITTSIVVSNTGNVVETYALSATTITPASPWAIAAAPAVDRFTLWTVVNSTQAGTADFTAGHRLSDAEASCGAAAFTMGNQTCVSVPIGQTRTLWFQISTPLATSTGTAQDVRITARAVKDP